MRGESKGASGQIAALGYEFTDSRLLETALTHRSSAGQNNERLEFLGDAVLAFVIAEHLYRRFPDATEGVLTRMRASLVRRETLAGVARELGLGEHIRLGGGERKSGGWRRDSILSNTVESLIGAVYLDGGIDRCRSFVLKLLARRLDGLSDTEPSKDPKTSLQEFLQARRRPLPIYSVIEESGEDHARLFRVRCLIEDSGQSVVGEGRSKRSAEQSAASMALELVQSHGT
jgi:ribonuclease-3